jgi:hypothetical protein
MNTNRHRPLDIVAAPHEQTRRPRTYTQAGNPCVRSWTDDRIATVNAREPELTKPNYGARLLDTAAAATLASATAPSIPSENDGTAPKCHATQALPQANARIPGLTAVPPTPRAPLESSRECMGTPPNRESGTDPCTKYLGPQSKTQASSLHSNASPFFFPSLQRESKYNDCTVVLSIGIIEIFLCVAFVSITMRESRTF